MNKLPEIIEKISDLPVEIPFVAITGMCKNAGKTTFLNWLTARLSQQGQVALLTTGRDGEDYDLVAGHEKPKVVIPQGSIFVTHSHILERFAGKVEILFKSDYKAGSFNIWVAKALQDLETEIVGPSTASGQIKLANQIKAYQPKFVIIDGSLDRKAITLKPEIDAMILVVSANYGTIDEIIAELKRLLLLTKIPQLALPKIENEQENLLFIKDGDIAFQLNTLLGFEKEINAFLMDNKVDQIYLPGVLTDTIWEKVKKSFIKNSQTLIINHPYQLHLSYDNLQRLLNQMKVYSNHKFIISGLALNSFSIKGRHLESHLLFEAVSKITNIPIIDCMEVL